ncbi:hypothetical protein HK097_000443, partial [Rhizophlyctis rosea]
MYHLHKVVLMQSPFFARMLLSETNQELIIVEGFLSLECANDHRITKEGMEISLRDLYDPTLTLQRLSSITPTNALSVLPSACFLELSDLASHCHSVLLSALSRSTIVDYAIHLDQIRPPRNQKAGASPYGVRHRYMDMWGEWHGKVEEAVVAFLGGLVNGYLGDEEKSRDVGEDDVVEVGEDGREKTPTARPMGLPEIEKLLTTLPLLWVRRVLESDTLCVANEFARYELIKRVAKARRSVPRCVKSEIDLEEAEYEKRATARKVRERLSLG